MGMRIEHRIEQKLTQDLRVTPQMILINKILQLQRLELKDEIEQNLKENPALEIVDQASCPKCGEPFSDSGTCRNCESSIEYSRQDQNEFKQREFDDLVSNWDSGHYEDATTYDKQSSDDEFDPLSNTASVVDVHQEIKRNYILTYPDSEKADQDIAEFMIDLIDEKGLIGISNEEIADEMKSDSARVEFIRDRIMHLEPIGLGASNPTQAMLMQLDNLSETLGKNVELEKTIIQNFRDHLARENCDKIAKGVGHFIKENLYAYPGDFFDDISFEQTNPEFYPEADVIIRKTETDYYPEIVDSGLPNFKISSFYLDAYEKIKSGNGSSFNEEEKKHIRQYFEKARFFLDCINQRRETIIRVCNFLIKYQREFLDHGIRKLKDLTREKVAEEVGFHPSTISRALKDKYVELPDKSIQSFDVFFDYQKVLVLVIKEILAKEETPLNVLSDENIAEHMKKLGFDVARRTVAKYRERGKIPPKNIRKNRMMETWKKQGKSSD
jgi:RNA polymerase sigma-54 factor